MKPANTRPLVPDLDSVSLIAPINPPIFFTLDQCSKVYATKMKIPCDAKSDYPGPTILLRSKVSTYVDTALCTQSLYTIESYNAMRKLTKAHVAWISTICPTDAGHMEIPWNS